MLPRRASALRGPAAARRGGDVERRADGLDARQLSPRAIVWVAQASGARFTDVDGFSYSDFNIADMSMFCGYAPAPVVRAVNEAMLAGNQFMRPTEDAITVSEELARRFGLPQWQYTSSASEANIEAIRIARVATGRDKVLLFAGKYHGHLDQTLVSLDGLGRVVAEERGLARDVASR